jgi:glycosyltransferase involved in cell wall biosynthesis
MRVAIDITQIIYGTGVSVYTRQLVENLVKLYPDHEYVLFGGSLRRNAEVSVFAEKFKNAKAVVTPISPTVADLLWNRLHVLNIETFIGKVDVFHSSDWAEPPSQAPKVTTIHDLAPLLLPQFTDKKIVATHRRRLYWVERESAAVIVPSEASKKDAIKIGISEKKVHVIPEALRPDIKKATRDEVERVKKRYRVNGKYSISIGNNKRKNTARIINAFEKSKVEAGLKTLVVVGNGDNHSYKNVVFTGFVPDGELEALLTGAELLVYPSLHEGFGLPILEAFKCDTPVVTSNISSMPEVAGKAAVLVNPESIEKIAEGILEALNKKKDLVKKGKEQLKKFSWQETARRTMGVYMSLSS